MKRNMKKWASGLLAVVMTLSLLTGVGGVTKAEAAVVTGDPDHTLTTLVQVTTGVVTKTAVEKYYGKYVMRFISAIPNVKDYTSVGFEISYTDPDTGATVTKRNKINTVFERIDSTNGGTTFSFDPKVVNADAQYFFTAKWPVAPVDADINYTVRAYGIADGEYHFGPSRCVSVNDGKTAGQVSLSFDAQLDPATAYTVTYTNAAGTDITIDSAHVEVLTSEAGHSNVRLTGANTNLNAVTEITITGGGDSYTTKLRNLYSESSSDTSWYDADKDKFVLTSAAELYGLAALSASTNFSGKTIYLSADIDLNPGCVANATGMSGSPKEWNKTIGTNAKPFAGTFDGQGHTVKGLYLNHEQQWAGMFGATSATATVQSFRLVNSYLNNDHHALGSIVGRGAGTVQSVYSNAFVRDGYHYVGGIVGQVSGGTLTVSKCWFDSSVTCTDGSGKDSYGGIVGDARSCTLAISDCLFTGSVTNSGKATTGGILGYMTGSPVTITDSLSAGTVTGNSNCGLMVGCNYGTTLRITTSYVLGDESSSNVIGWLSGSETHNVLDYIYGGKLYENVARDTGYKQIPVVIVDESKDSEQCHGDAAATTLAGFDFDETWSTVAGGVPALRQFNRYAEDTVRISTAEELMEFAARSQTENFAGKTIYLSANIDLNPGWDANTKAAPANVWTSIGRQAVPFAGTFDGRGHTISGVYLSATANRQGLFGELASTAVVENFQLTNSYFTTSELMLGAIAGMGNGTLQNVYTDAIVESPYGYVGGMVAYVNTGANMTIKECWFNGTARQNTGTKKDHYGGIVGYATGCTLAISDCLFTGTVNSGGDSNYTGGLVATAYGGAKVTITNSLSAGTVTGGSSSGLMVGINQSTGTALRLTNAYVLGTEGSARVVGYNYNGAATVTIDYIVGNTLYENVNRSSNSANIPIFIVDESKVSEQYRGDGAKSVFAGFDFDENKTWAAVYDWNPVPARFVGFAVADHPSLWLASGTARDPYVLSTADEFREFVSRAQTDDFAGKTVKLATDIDLNPAWTASSAAPANTWTPLGTNAQPFAGTFDGDGHTISGLYCSSTTRYAGFFAAVTGEVKNLTIANSYFASTNKSVGAVAGRGSGNLSAVHCAANVTVQGKGNVGGLLGEADGSDMLLDGCSFAGSVINASNTQPNVGGLIGLCNCNVSVMTLTVQNCLQTGTVDASANYTDADPSIGGLIGRVFRTSSAYTVTVLIDSCLSAGVVTPNEAAITEATAKTGSAPYGRFSPIVGNSPATGIVEIAKTYVTDEVCSAFNELSSAQRIATTNVRAEYNAVTEAAVKANAEAAMPLLDWTVWSASAGNFPTPAASAAGAATYVASSAALSTLDSLYDGLTLYRGDMHEHAGEPYRVDGKPSTEVTYAQYAAQIGELGIDFAASLNHKQTSHIDDPDWDKTKFVYGTEAGTYIVSGNAGSGTGQLHFDILFKNKADLQYIINKYMASFDSVTGKYEYNDAFTRAGFILMINEVMSRGGFFNIPHPLDSNMDYTDNEMDYWFVDGIGIHVMTHSYWDDMSVNQRQLWVDLLNAGKKVYATAGTDEHNALTGTTKNSTPFGLRALTSVYADSSANTDKGNLIPYLRQGVFTAGDAGIQMCVGNDTKMGGTCSFNGKDLVIRIADKGSSKYRVNVLSNDGLVYSREMKVGSNTEIRLPADSSAMYYRVEIIDTSMTHRGEIVAYGNPIWND